MENRDYTLLVILVIVTAVAVSAADAAGIPKKAISTVGAFIESDLPSATVFTDKAQTYTAGDKQTFQNSGTTAGLNLAASTDPSSLSAGDLWLSTTTANTLKYQTSGGTQVVGALGLAQTWTGANTFSHNINTFTASNTGVVISNPADSFATTLAGGAVSANRTLNLPAITGSDTLAALGLSQTWGSGAKQTFVSSATTAGLNLAPSADPSSLANGDTWLSSTNADVLKYRAGGTTYNIQSTKNAAASTVVAAPGTGTSGTTFVAAGLAATVTPATTGRILVIVSVNVLSATSLDGAFIQIMHDSTSSSSAPAHNGAVPGTATSDCTSLDVRSTGTTSPGGTGTISCVITGLTLGTQYWVDLEYKSDTATKAATLNNAIVSIVEV